jgi:hypothetical protein
LAATAADDLARRKQILPMIERAQRKQRTPLKIRAGTFDEDENLLHRSPMAGVVSATPADTQDGAAGHDAAVTLSAAL